MKLVTIYRWVPFWMLFLLVGLITGNPLITLSAAIFPLIHFNHLKLILKKMNEQIDTLEEENTRSSEDNEEIYE